MWNIPVTDMIMNKVTAQKYNVNFIGNTGNGFINEINSNTIVQIQSQTNSNYISIQTNGANLLKVLDEYSKNPLQLPSSINQYWLCQLLQYFIPDFKFSINYLKIVNALNDRNSTQICKSKLQTILNMQSNTVIDILIRYQYVIYYCLQLQFDDLSQEQICYKLNKVENLSHIITNLIHFENIEPMSPIISSMHNVCTDIDVCELPPPYYVCFFYIYIYI